MHMYIVKIMLIRFYIKTVFSSNPCNEYISTNDTSMSTAERELNHCQNFEKFRWYRFTKTQEGYMTSSCPDGRRCGNEAQIWFNDTIPTVDEGEAFKHVCVHNGTECCILKNMIKTKNCTDFIIYFLVPVQSCQSYCFEAPEDENVVAFPEDKPNKLVIWVIVPVFAVIIITSILFVVIRRIFKRRNKSKQVKHEESDTTENMPNVTADSLQNARRQFDVHLLQFNQCEGHPS